MLHLTGNLRQRFLSVIGDEPDQRDRPAEFAARGPIAGAKLLADFEETVARIERLLSGFEPVRLVETRRYAMLRGEVENSVLGVALQTLVHLGGHTQEIIALTRRALGDQYRFLENRAARQPGPL